ncbi:MAG TPA: acylphosphatase [Burkholderiales bacterium]
MTVTKQLRIYGRVQGVGYRYALRREAVAHGVAGWVRNLRDGTVEALLQGDEAAVDAVAAWAQRGPPAAIVERVDIRPAEESAKHHAGFEQLPTA